MDFKLFLDNSTIAQETGMSDFLMLSMDVANDARLAIDFPAGAARGVLADGMDYRLVDGKLYEPEPLYPFGDRSSAFRRVVTNSVRFPTDEEVETSGRAADITDTEYGQLISERAKSCRIIGGRIYVPSIGPTLVLHASYGPINRQPVTIDIRGEWHTSSDSLLNHDLRRGIFRYDRIAEAYDAVADTGIAMPPRTDETLPFVHVDGIDLPDDRDIRTESLAVMVESHFSNCRIDRIPRALLQSLTDLRGILSHSYRDGDWPEPTRWEPNLFSAFEPLPASALSDPLSRTIATLDTLPLVERDLSHLMIAKFISNVGLTPNETDELVLGGLTL